MKNQDVSLDVFTYTVLHAAHKEYSKKRKKVTITKAIKLIIKIAEEIEYTNVSYGCYKYGEYSFQLYDILKPAFPSHSLHGLKKREGLIDFDLEKVIQPIIKKYEKLMTGGYASFLKWAHEDRIPEEYRTLYRTHDEILSFFYDIKKIRDKNTLKTNLKRLPDLISIMDKNLNHVDEKGVELYYGLSDCLEGLSIIIAYRNEYNFVNLKKILKQMGVLYTDNLSSLLFPYDLTLKGSQEANEIERYNTSYQNKLESSKIALKRVNIYLNNNNLKPTIYELDMEINNELIKMDSEGRLELLNQLKI